MGSEMCIRDSHGSANSQPETLIDWCRPDVAVASCGRGRLKPEVATTLSALPCRFFRTDKDGAVCVTLSDAGVRVKTFPAGEWVNEPPAVQTAGSSRQRLLTNLQD